MVTHLLKCVPPFFADVLYGVKTFEIRKNDRDYQLGDFLFLREYISTTNKYTNRLCLAKIIYITNWEQKSDFVVMGLEIATDINSRLNSLTVNK